MGHLPRAEPWWRVAITLYSAMSLAGQGWIALRWLLRHDGPGATNHFESGGFVRSRSIGNTSYRLP
jgi:hypothetical protein